MFSNSQGTSVSGGGQSTGGNGASMGKNATDVRDSQPAIIWPRIWPR